jgi:hypothetical protein
MAYAACPKCAHAPLPADQSLPAACPGCGLILAKFSAVVSAAAAQRGAAHPAERDATTDGTVGGHSDAFNGTRDEETGFLSRWLFHVPAEVSDINWYGRIVALLVFGVWTFFIWRDMDIPAGESGSYFLHVVLTPFHEAGHYAIFRWFGQFIMTLGGTLGQHLMPIVLGCALLIKRRDAFGAAIFFWLLGYSVSDMGVYMYDAFDPKLMLLDGKTGADSDGHDWQNIFGDLGLLRNARGIGVFWGVAGRVMMFAGLAWAAWMVWLQRANLSKSPFAESDPH